MEDPGIVRHGEGRSIMVGPDRHLVRKGGKDTSGRFDFLEVTVSYLADPRCTSTSIRTIRSWSLAADSRCALDQLADMVPGDLISAPPGIPHTFTNLEREPAHIMNVMTPGGFDRTLEEFAALLRLPIDPAILADFAARHRMALVGPPLADELGLK